MTQDAPLLPNATRNLAEFAAGLRFDDIPDTVIDHAKLCVLDGLGVALFGAGLPWTGHARDVTRAEGATPAASFWGTPFRGSIAQAALVNGTAGHAFETDDIHKESIVHPNSLACPVAFAFAEAAGGMSGRDVLTAIIAGYEVGTRVGNAATMALFRGGSIHRARPAPSSLPRRPGASLACPPVRRSTRWASLVPWAAGLWRHRKARW